MAKRKRPTARKQERGPGPDRYPDVMTIDQVAGYLQLHKQVVYRHVKNGNIPVSRIGATIRFKKSVIDAWLEDSALRSLGKSGEREEKSGPSREEKFVWE